MTVKIIAALLSEDMDGGDKKEIVRRILEILDMDFGRGELEEASKLLKHMGVESIDLDIAVDMVDNDYEGARSRIEGPTDRGTGFGVRQDMMNVLGELVAGNQRIESVSAGEVIQEKKMEAVGVKGKAEVPAAAEKEGEGLFSKKVLKASWEDFATRELGLGGADKKFVEVGRKNVRTVYFLQDGSRYYEANIDDEQNWNVHYQCYRAYRKSKEGIIQTRGD